MIKKRYIWWKFTNIHLYAAIAVYAIMSILQIGLPEQFDGTRDILTAIQLVMMVGLMLLLMVNLVKNWE
jgi:hypothetical protein